MKLLNKVMLLLSEQKFIKVEFHQLIARQYSTLYIYNITKTFISQTHKSKTSFSTKFISGKNCLE